MKTVEAIFFDLVTINSPSGNESGVASYIQDFLNPMGFTFRHDTMGNLFARHSGKGEAFFFCAHMDTVQPGEGIVPVHKNGRITSQGETILGADNKAALAAMLFTVSQVKPDDFPPLELLFTVKEETGGGVDFFPVQWMKAKSGFIFDHAAPLGTLITASPYITNFSIEYFGKAAHTKNPADGISAIVPLAHCLAGFLPTDFPNTLVNFGCISGGSGANIIPEKSKVYGEVRSFSEPDFLKAIAYIQMQSKKTADAYKVRFVWNSDGYCPGYQIELNSFAFHWAQNVLKKVGIKSKGVSTPGVSDANILRDRGLDVVVLSDGVQNPHSTKESISISSLHGMVEIMTEFMRDARRNGDERNEIKN